jgi:hypothetical protein
MELRSEGRAGARVEQRSPTGVLLAGTADSRRRIPVCPRILSIFLFTVCLALASAVRAGSINFESVPGGSPSELLPIGDQYLATEGISFSLEEGGLPVLAEVGGPAHAFVGPPAGTQADGPDPSETGLGSFFLTDDGALPGIPKTILMSFADPVSTVTGVMLDVDRSSLEAFESWQIEARDAASQVIDTLTILAGMPDTGDGIATAWGFQHTVNDITSLRFVYTGMDNPWIGFALDDIVTAQIPEPGTLLLLVVGLGGLAARRGRGA